MAQKMWAGKGGPGGEISSCWPSGAAGVTWGAHLPPGGTVMTPPAARLRLVAEHDPASGSLLERLLRLSVRALPRMYDSGEFSFTLAGVPRPRGEWQLRPAGTSLRYSAITALGLLRLPAAAQRQILGGDGADDLVGNLAKRLDTTASLGDVALICWAAAEAGHSELPHALRRLAQLDRPGGPLDVVAAAWLVTALAAARRHADVEQHLSAARDRLLAARHVAYPHVTGGPGSWLRSHVGSFADQVYPIQALARLHASGDDGEALATAESLAALICGAQGEAGQWWWHYDARSGDVIEGYPVYSVHQHAMAPMALLDLADAGGPDYLEPICRGLRWMVRRPETSEHLILEEPPVTWRKVARGDHRKMVRGLRAAAARLSPEWRLPLLDHAFPPRVVDHECRPYELGWLLFTWLR